MRPKTAGYTLTEICIVMTILCTVSMVLVPHFSRAAGQARASALDDCLTKVRDAIDLYRLDHDKQLPGCGKANWTEAMCGCTDKFGTIYTEKLRNMGLEKCGPYISKVPANPFNDLRTVRINGQAAGADTHGWRFDTATGEFQADNKKVLNVEF